MPRNSNHTTDDYSAVLRIYMGTGSHYPVQYRQSGQCSGGAGPGGIHIYRPPGCPMAINQYPPNMDVKSDIANSMAELRLGSSAVVDG